MKGDRFRLVHRYAGREYLLSLLVAFAFFFFIFFVNQILLIAQKILVKNVSLSSVVKLVMLAIPQFLLYTFPFSSLTASAMVLGEFSTTGEILALRSSGISLRHLFAPICVLALMLSGITLFTADVLLPISSREYKKMYVQMMRDLPTIELSSYAANTIGDRVMTNGVAEGSTVNDLVLFSAGGTGNGRDEMISAPKADIRLDDPVSFIYSLTLQNPVIFSSDTQQRNKWNLAKAEEVRISLDFSNQIPSVTDTLPSQLSLKQLKTKSDEKQVVLEQDRFSQQANLMKEWNSLASMSEDERLNPSSFNSAWNEYRSATKEQPISFYYQYYRAEMQKKLALSSACFLLVFLTFPLAYMRLKHGRLVGFGIAMLSSVVYWYLLFFAQLNIFKTALNPAFLIWMPDFILFVIGMVILWRMRR
jgi:lipopolysaccharide export system permease protein